METVGRSRMQFIFNVGRFIEQWRTFHAFPLKA